MIHSIKICQLPYQDRPFVHGIRDGEDVWLKRDGTWSNIDGDPECSLELGSFEPGSFQRMALGLFNYIAELTNSHASSRPALCNLKDYIKELEKNIEEPVKTVESPLQYCYSCHSTHLVGGTCEQKWEFDPRYGQEGYSCTRCGAWHDKSCNSLCYCGSRSPKASSDGKLTTEEIIFRLKVLRDHDDWTRIVDPEGIIGENLKDGVCGAIDYIVKTINRLETYEAQMQLTEIALKDARDGTTLKDAENNWIEAEKACAEREEILKLYLKWEEEVSNSQFDSTEKFNKRLALLTEASKRARQILK